MKKIPTLFRRDPDDMRQVLPEVVPGCEWVLAGEGKATRKYDGTCVMLDDDGGWWARREVKPGKHPPDRFRKVDHDETTGKTVGWEPIEQSAFFKWFREAWESTDGFEPGTYELCGPKVNGNPEGFESHILIPHATADKLYPHSLDFDGIRETVHTLADRFGVEGLVWHHPDGRMAKIKARDFPRVKVTP